jgi:hypothetical protein
MYSSGIIVIWHAQSQLEGFVLRLYMYSSGITVIWHAQSQLVGFVCQMTVIPQDTYINVKQNLLIDFEHARSRLF